MESSAVRLRRFVVVALLSCVPVSFAVLGLALVSEPAYAANDLLDYGEALAGTLTELVVMFRTILFFVLVIGLLWFVAMFVSGRPAIKPVITCVVAAIMLGGIQVILNTFLVVDADNGLKNSPSDMLQY